MSLEHPSAIRQQNLDPVTFQPLETTTTGESTLWIADGRIYIDPDTEQLVCDDRPVDIPQRTQEVLRQYMSRPDTIISREEATVNIWKVYTKATLTNLYVNLNGARKSFKDPELSDPVTGALRTRRSLGTVAVKSMFGETYLWNEEDHEILSSLNGYLEINNTTKVAKIEDELMNNLSPQEFALFYNLAINQGITLTPSRLISILEDQGSAKPHKVYRVIMSTLCKKINEKLRDDKPQIIQRDRYGYRLVRSL
jgi:DNA-binding response OmpR family regulator